MKFKTSRPFKYFLLCISMAFLLPAVSHADIEQHIIETGTGFYYVVQKGDTLWDLSENFSDSAWHWPDLWQHNPKISNPHLIYPGQRIQIHKKSWKDVVETPVDIEIPKPAKYFSYSGIDAIGFIRQTEAENYGSVIKVKENKRLISDGDRVFIRPNGSSMVEGNTYAIYRTNGSINDPITSEYIGVQHIITGIAHISEIQPEYVVGVISSSFRDIREGDIITPFINRDKKIEMREGVPGLTGILIKGEEGQRLIGEHMIAFIDKGKNDNVEIGQTYNLFYQETTSAVKNQEPIILTKESLGEMLVLHTEDTTATVVITNSLNQIPEGTAFRALASK